MKKLKTPGGKNINQTQRLTKTSLMAAVIFITTAIGIRIPIGGTDAILHFGNTFCILSGLLLDPLSAALAAGIGSGLFDLLCGYAGDTLMSFTNKFLITLVTALIVYRSKEVTPFRIVLASLIGNITYLILYLTKNMILAHFIQGMSINASIMVVASKAVINLTNAVIAFIFSLILYPILKKILKNSHGINSI